MPRPSSPIVCIGGANVDRKLQLLAKPLPGSSNPCAQRDGFGGVARNVAENLARLGHPVNLIATWGNDPAGRALAQHAQACGINIAAAITLDGQLTDSYTAVLSPDGELHIGLAAMPLVQRLTAALLQASADLRARSPLWVVDLNLPQESVAALIAEASTSPARLVVVAVSEAKMARLPQDLRGVDCLLLNRGELGCVDADTDRAIAALHARGVRQLVLTLGADGLRCSDAAQAAHSLAAPPVAVVDVTGAGDALAAGLCAGLLRGLGLVESCRLGQALAAWTLQCAANVHPALDPLWLDQHLPPNA